MAARHWTLEDIPWDRFDPSKVDPDLLRLVKAASLVEYNGGDYAAYLCNVFPDDPKFQEAARLWAAVYVHDLARTHDGTCSRHGADAARLLDTDPTLLAHLARGGLESADLPAVAEAVRVHSLPGEVAPDHPHRRLVRLLKDADGLDRVRLRDLDPRRLRHDEARALVPFAQRLLAASEQGLHRDPAPFLALFGIAGDLIR